MSSVRQQLDRLFAFDAIASVVIGTFALVAPHHVIQELGGGYYNHAVHETLRLYGCLRLACGWILWHASKVDDGMFRKHICEALGVCYFLQALSVARAQWTDASPPLINWIILMVLASLSLAYGSFRLRKGGNLIKIYELPTSSVTN